MLQLPGDLRRSVALVYAVAQDVGPGLVLLRNVARFLGPNADPSKACLEDNHQNLPTSGLAQLFAQQTLIDQNGSSDCFAYKIPLLPHLLPTIATTLPAGTNETAPTVSSWRLCLHEKNDATPKRGGEGTR